MESDLIAIREGLAAMLLTAPSIKGSDGWPPDNVGAIPFAFVGFDDDAPTMGGGGPEIHLHQIPITVLVNHSGGNLKNELKAVERVISEFLTAVRARQSLGMPTRISRVEPTRIVEGVYQFAGHDYVGFIATVTIKETFGATYPAG